MLKLKCARAIRNNIIDKGITLIFMVNIQEINSKLENKNIITSSGNGVSQAEKCEKPPQRTTRL